MTHGRACLLHNRDWARVNIKPRRYVGCRVDVAGNMYLLQVMDGYVEYNTNLDPNGSHEWDVFAQDYADNPPSIPNDTYVRIKGTFAGVQQVRSPYANVVRTNRARTRASTLGRNSSIRSYTRESRFTLSACRKPHARSKPSTASACLHCASSTP